MNDAKWERYAAFGGVLFVVASTIGAMATGEPPAPDDSAATITEWFTEYDTGLLISQVGAGIGSMGLLWWAGTLWRRLSRAEGQPRLAVVSMLGLAVAGALAMVTNSIWTAVALRIDDIGDGSQALYVVAVMLFIATGFFVAMHIGAASAIGMRTKTLPRWLCILGAVDALAFVAAGVMGSVSDSQTGMIISFVSSIAWMVWILGVSAVMWRDGATSAAAA